MIYRGSRADSGLIIRGRHGCDGCGRRTQKGNGIRCDSGAIVDRATARRTIIVPGGFGYCFTRASRVMERIGNDVPGDHKEREKRAENPE
jgi:hypothetical protein